jgi:three-Cys-motif partner protein
MSQSEHIFGGQWTEDKLKRLEEYLKAYRVIFSKSASTRRFQTWYVDAFSGTGFRSERRPDDPYSGCVNLLSLLDGYEPETPAFTPPRKGSAQIALGLDSPFNHYLFIERSANHIRQLESMIDELFPHLQSRCTLLQQDANSALCSWVRSVDWRRNRAVVFLDPYGMQVEWTTITALAATKAIDLWYLFPLATLSRMMPKNGSISDEWKHRIDVALGTSEWLDYFYPDMYSSLLDGSPIRLREAGVEKLRTFVNGRLSTCFVAVADGLVLKNSKGSPMFLFCFAAANEVGAPLALGIANHILNPKQSRKGVARGY